MAERIVIIGAGQAGAQAAASLRQSQFDGEIVMFGEEPAHPYQRPPLSKAYLKGELAMERLLLRPPAFYEANRILLRTGEKVVGLDRAARNVITDDGAQFGYDKALLATGAPPRRLNAPGAELRNIFYLRTMVDADAIRAALDGKERIVIVGAGYIGLEVAAVARAAGLDVTVLEMADRVLARVAGAPVSSFYEALHKDAGVDLRLGATLAGFAGADGALTGAELSSGEVIPCGAALVGVGARPAMNLAAAAGLETGDGIIVDDHSRTNDNSIWAAGDCTNFPSARYGRRVRLESVPNAVEQAKVAAANMAGGDEVYDPLPWFWSDQYDVKLQTVGLGHGYDALVVRGSPGARAFSVWYFSGDEILAVDAINDPAAFLTGKKLIAARAVVDRERIADAAADLKALLG